MRRLHTHFTFEPPTPCPLNSQFFHFNTKDCRATRRSPETVRTSEPNEVDAMSPRDPPVIGADSVHHGNEIEATASMCHYCFDVLITDLKKTGWKITPDFLHHLPYGNFECPLFVTWDKQKHLKVPQFELRGCIGTLSPRPLVLSIKEYALTSALRDRRFHPVHISELPHLRVSVSLLVRYEICDHCYDWNPGTHGIIIRWTSDDSENSREYSATYLPEVARDQNWDQRTAVESLIRKAGYNGHMTDELLRKIHCTRYQSSKHRVTFDEYLLARRGHDDRDILGLIQEDRKAPQGTSGTCTIA
jgi:uncharacterized protein (TIGR00296 family)